MKLTFITYRITFTVLCILFSAFSLNAQQLFSVSQNTLSQENVTQLRNQIIQTNISTLSLTRNNENKNVYRISLTSNQDKKIIILNEQTGNHVVITPAVETWHAASLPTEFQLAPFFIEELKRGVLGNASQYLVMETTADFSVRNINAVAVSNDDIFIPRYFYGKKEAVKEAFPDERQIVSIYKQKPQLISAFPNDFEHQQYIAQMEENMSYYLYIYQLPDGTLCTFDEHFSPKQGETLSSTVADFLEFNLTGTMTPAHKLATEYALELWSEQLAGTVPVDIMVQTFSLGQGVLGMSYFPPKVLDPVTQIWYPSALWKQLVGYVYFEEKDISIVMNSDYKFYLGLDGNTSGMDFVTIMIHEVTHGLGFGSICSPEGVFPAGKPGIYDCQLYQGLNGPCFAELTISERAALLISENLYSGAPSSNLLTANNGIRVKMYAPKRYSGGSTAHHWDSNVGFINFMEYAYTYPLHTFNNRKIGIMKDLGYELPVIDSANTVKVTFYSNGGTGVRNPQLFTPGVAQKLKINSFSKKGYIFYSWNTEQDGTGESYADRESITIDHNIDLYAQWSPATYKLTFYPNQGTVTPSSKPVVFGSPIGEFPIPVRKGFNFVGWSIGYNNFITEETIWKYAMDNTAIAFWSEAVAIDETQDNHSIKIHPNPTTGELRIESSMFNVQCLEIFDIFGKKLSTHTLTPTSSHHIINISHLKSGVYLIKMENENGMITKKIIKY